MNLARFLTDTYETNMLLRNVREKDDNFQQHRVPYGHKKKIINV
jgi:hypothetical protein